MGNKGGNGNGKKNPFTTPEPKRVTKWIDPGTLKFRPSDRQKEFRDVAIRCVEEGKFFLRSWFESSRGSKVFEKAPVRHSEWQEWNQSDGFKQWFYSEFLEYKGPSEFEFSMMDQQFWDGVCSAMIDNREWSYKLYAKVRWGGKDSIRTKEDAAEMALFLGSGDEAKQWMVDVAEA